MFITKEKLANLKKKYPQLTEAQLVDILKDAVKVSEDEVGKISEDISALFESDADRSEAAADVYNYQQLIQKGEAIRLENEFGTETEVEKKSLFLETLGDIGVSESYFIPKIPLLTIAYGYTRGNFESNKVLLNPFPGDKIAPKKIPLYVNKVETEGILFEFDRKRIIDWLISNNIIKKPSSSSEDYRSWFLNNIKTHDITTFTGAGSDL